MKDLINLLVNRHLTVGRFTGLLLTAFIIAALFPRSNFRYDFEQGKPWVYEDFKAPFAFGIQKSEADINAEKEKISKEFTPHYLFNDTLVADRQKAVQKDFIAFYNKISTDSLQAAQVDSAYYQQTISEVLSELYEKGIVSLVEEHQKEGQVISLQKNGISETIGKENLLNPNDAYSFVQEKINKDSSLSSSVIIPILFTQISANVIYDKKTSEKILNTQLAAILPIRGKVQVGERIVTNGQIVDSETFQKLTSIQTIIDDQQTNGQNLWDYVGYVLIISVLLILFLTFIKQHAPELYRSIRKLGFIYLALVSFFFLLRSIINIDIPNLLYIVPFCILPIVFRTFFGTLVALFLYVMVLLLCSFMLPVSYDFIYLQFIAGMVALLTGTRSYYWAQFFTSIGLIFLTYSFGFVILHLIQNNGLQGLEINSFGWFFVNALLTLLAFPFIPLVEKLFGFISNLTLVELSDVNKPLLKELEQKAPGSFWHSIQVASLAEKAATAIGANPLLSKVGALYHDVGKLDNPLYFIENQNTAMNPHDDLGPLESKDIIIGHVTKGIEIAKKNGLPNILIDFIRTHHGTTRTEYFYKRHLQEHPNETVDEKTFRYPGPLPYSKETAIVMMADSIEAASMSLQNPSGETIDELVEKIIQFKIDQQQLTNCDLSFKDIRIAAEVFKKMLRSKYHIRVKY